MSEINLAKENYQLFQFCIWNLKNVSILSLIRIKSIQKKKTLKGQNHNTSEVYKIQKRKRPNEKKNKNKNTRG